MEIPAVIIGAGPAGISAGIYLIRAGINFLMIAKNWGGEMALSGEINNYPGVFKISGEKLTEKFKEHLLNYKIPIIEYPESNSAGIILNADCQKIEKTNDLFVIKIFKEKIFELKTKSIILATGTKPKRLKIPGEKKFYQKGVSYCSICDGPLFKDKIVAVIGGGNSAVKSALMLANICQKVYLLTINQDLEGEKIAIDKLKKTSNVEILPSVLTQEIFGDKFVKGLNYLDQKENKEKTLNVEGIFINIGREPNSEMVPEKWNIKNQKGYILTNSLMETKVEGFFSAGDVVEFPFKQIIISASQGAIAGLKLAEYLNSL